MAYGAAPIMSLGIVLQRGEELVNAGIGREDPYVVVSVAYGDDMNGPEVARAEGRTHENAGRRPDFKNELINVDLSQAPPPPGTKIWLKFQVFDKNRRKDKDMGLGYVEISRLAADTDSAMAVELSRGVQRAGRIFVSVTKRAQVASAPMGHAPGMVPMPGPSAPPMGVPPSGGYGGPKAPAPMPGGPPVTAPPAYGAGGPPGYGASGPPGYGGPKAPAPMPGAPPAGAYGAYGASAPMGGPGAPPGMSGPMYPAPQAVMAAGGPPRPPMMGAPMPGPPMMGAPMSGPPMMAAPAMAAPVHSQPQHTHTWQGGQETLRVTGTRPEGETFYHGGGDAYVRSTSTSTGGVSRPAMAAPARGVPMMAAPARGVPMMAAPMVGGGMAPMMMAPAPMMMAPAPMMAAPRPVAVSMGPGVQMQAPAGSSLAGALGMAASAQQMGQMFQ